MDKDGYRGISKVECKVTDNVRVNHTVSPSIPAIRIQGRLYDGEIKKLLSL